MSRLGISPDITQSSTLPSYFYRQESFFEESKEKIFAHTWHYVADATAVKNPGDVHPFLLLEGVLDEPLILLRDQAGQLLCLSNVCTHRGKIIVEKAGNFRQLTCGYHGRCFHLDGHFKRMPSFEDTLNFPSLSDNLTKLTVKEWMGLVFVSINPKFSFEEAIVHVSERTEWRPLDLLEFVGESSKDYYLNAHWALYCDNFLEGFHIPFVHPALHSAIEFEEYETEVFPFGSLQIGIAKEAEPYFEIPHGHPDSGKKIYAYYFHLFPNLMLNFYPWGLSLNVVEPLGAARTKVRFRTYRFVDKPFDHAANSLEITEMEDERVVESVQKGIQSRFYQRGRFSPKMEKCVHHFHRMIDAFMS